MGLIFTRHSQVAVRLRARDCIQSGQKKQIFFKFATPVYDIGGRERCYIYQHFNRDVESRFLNDSVTLTT